MIKFVGKTTRGSAVPRNLSNFSTLLEDSFADLRTQDTDADWNMSSLDQLANKTLFQTIFNSIFGSDKASPDFNYKLFHDNFHTFHKYFSYLWLGLPHCFFPEATKAVSKLFAQPTPSQFMQSDCTSEYLKAAIEYLKGYDMSDQEIKCHNLVFLHININTFKIATWCLYQLMANKAAMSAVREEIDQLIEANAEEQNADGEVAISSKDIEGMKILGNCSFIQMKSSVFIISLDLFDNRTVTFTDSLVNETFRMSSGVFMIRHNQQDVNFTVASTNETYKIRAGDKVMMYPPAIHKDPEIFEEPEVSIAYQSRK